MDCTSYNFSETNEQKKTIPVQKEGFQIPDSYGDNKIVLMVRDPWTIFAYWETCKDIENRIKDEIRNKGLNSRGKHLRVYDVTETAVGHKADVPFDFETKDFTESWYIHIGSPGKKWVAEIGYLCATGEFFPIVRSNVVETPVYSMSEVVDSDWMCSEEEYKKMFDSSGVDGVGTSSFELKELLERHLKSWMSSGVIGGNTEK